MAEDDTSIDELSEQIQQLSSEDRADLLQAIQGDQLETYLEARGEYVDRLREEGLVADYPPDSPWAEYCREHPEDPICQRIVTSEQLRDRLQKYQRARGQFVDRLREGGLLSDEQMDPMTGLGGTMGLAGALGQPEVGFTPDPRNPWPPICLLFPWACGNLGLGTPGPRADPIPFPASTSWQQLRGGMGSRGVTAMSGMPSASGQLPMGGQIPQSGSPVGGMPGVPGEFADLRFDLCRYFPELPECDGFRCPPWQPWCPDPCELHPELPWCQPCPPICRYFPGLRICRWCR